MILKTTMNKFQPWKATALNVLRSLKKLKSEWARKRLTADDVRLLNSEITTAEGALRWASDNLCPSVGKASSFGAEDAAVIDMMVKITPEFQFFTLDTGFLPKETLDIIAAVEDRYGIKVERLKPDPERVEHMVEERGTHLFYESVEGRKTCCHVRKVEPMNAKLATLNGWITGLRRDQTEARRDMEMFELDSAHGGIVKINPIINWSIEDVWGYVRAHGVPYNALLDRGYTSIGCEPCTRAVKPGEDPRAGRWWWERGVKECGLHVARNVQ